MEEKLWDRDMMERYPLTYGGRNDDMTKTCLCWGFEGLGENCKPLMEELSKQIEEYNKGTLRRKEEFLKNGGILDELDFKYMMIEITQVKEKYDQLRVYTNYMVEQVDEYIRQAENAYEALFGRPPIEWVTYESPTENCKECVAIDLTCAGELEEECQGKVVYDETGEEPKDGICLI